MRSLGADCSLCSVNAATRADIVSQFEAKWLHPAEVKPVPRVHAVWRVVPSSNMEARFQRYKLRVAQAIEAETHDDFDMIDLRNESAFTQDYVEDEYANTRRRFHGTKRMCAIGDTVDNLHPCTHPECSICRIIRTGFRLPDPTDPEAKQRARLGQGIYSTATSSKAHDYTDTSARTRSMLVVKVVAGRVFKRYDTWTEADMLRTAPPDGHDSVLGEVHPDMAADGGSDEGGEEGFVSVPMDAGELHNPLRYDELVVFSEAAVVPAYLVTYQY